MASSHGSRTEQFALKLSLLGTVIMGMLGLIFGYLSDSKAIFLDGIFSLLSIGMTGLTLYISILLKKPDNRLFQFGYAHLEPLMNVINGLFILLTCVLAFTSGFLDLFKEKEPINLQLAVCFALFSTVFSFAIFFIEYRISKKQKSELVYCDSQEWLIDSLLSTTILFGFLLVVIFDKLKLSQLTTHMDSYLVMIIAVSAAIFPIKILKRNIKEVLLVAPKDDYQKEVDSYLSQLCKKLKFDGYTHHLAKTGRQYDLEVNFLVKNDKKWTMKRQDRVRQLIWTHFKRQSSNTWLSVSFTTEKRWL